MVFLLRWTKPIHSMIDNIRDFRMPITFRFERRIVYEIRHRVRVLDTVELTRLAISNSQDEVTSSVGIGETTFGVFERVVELQDVAE